ncbi:hypothetical protein PENTCL1PPCAC_3912, partial [Pristionchus entomophagus]
LRSCRVEEFEIHLYDICRRENQNEKIEWLMRNVSIHDLLFKGFDLVGDSNTAKIIDLIREHPVKRLVLYPISIYDFDNNYDDYARFIIEALNLIPAVEMDGLHLCDGEFDPHREHKEIFENIMTKLNESD